MTATEMISPNQLKSLIGTPECPVIVDVRRRKAFGESDRMIVTAQWRDPEQIAQWAAEFAARGEDGRRRVGSTWKKSPDRETTRGEDGRRRVGSTWEKSPDRETTGAQVVVYCVHGHEVSQGAADALRQAGVDARFLEGGIEAFIEAGGETAAK